MTEESADGGTAAADGREPCRNCGTPTTQRAEGIPYCSIDCIKARRLEQAKETIKCPYPRCDWETSYLPGNGLSKSIAYRKADEHREEHWSHRPARGRDRADGDSDE